MGARGAGYSWRQTTLLGALMVAVAALWNTWAVYPLKILVVFFHELSHALVGFATGGTVAAIHLEAAQGGFCIVQGGNPLLILMAGYLGSLAWGGIVLLMASRTRYAKVTTGALGAMVFVVGLVFIRPVVSFGFLFAGAAGAAMMIAGRYLSPWVNAVLLKAIGLTSCLYAILDIKSDTLDRPQLRSDAHMLAELTGIPTVVWGGLWISLAIAGTLVFVRMAMRRDLSQR